MSINYFKKTMFFTLITTLIISILVNPISAYAQSTELTNEELKAISSGAFYNKETGLYEYDENIAINNGATRTQATSVGNFLESLSKKDVKEFNQAIGFDPEQKEESDGTSTRAIPAILIPIAKFLGGAAGAAIIAEVTLYGIAKACQNLEGKYGFFDDFCETRGYI